VLANYFNVRLRPVAAQRFGFREPSSASLRMLEFANLSLPAVLLERLFVRSLKNCCVLPF
jgi:hypothetical protein